MQNRKEFRQKELDGSKKNAKNYIRKIGKSIIFGKGGGINIVYGSKYGPLQQSQGLTCNLV
jgi:hypothetical protein